MEEGRARKIMVALEDSEKSIYALEWALSYLVPPPSDLAIGPDHFVILYVSPQSLPKMMNIREVDVFTSHVSGALEDKHKFIVDHVKRMCENHNVTYEMKAMVGEAKLVICEAAKKLEVDLLVIGNHDYGGFKRLFSWRSVGDYCVHHAKCPVLVVKGHQNVGVGDEESLPIGNRIQPLSSTPRPEEWRREDSTKTSTTTFAQLLSERLGLPELFSLEVWRASVAEMIGTAALVFLIDTIVISSLETETKTPNLVIAALVFLSISILLIATAPISGGHINPIVTFSAMLIGLISPARSTIYILAQCIGGVLGALALKAIISDTIEMAYSLGGCTLTVIAPGSNGPITVGIETGPGLWLEIICSFIFLYASIWMVFDGRQAKAHGLVKVCFIVGAVLGLLVFVSTTLTAKKGYSGAGLNPARCVGPALVRGGHLWDGHWVFWVGPTIACLAFYLYVKIIPRQHFHAHEYKYDFFTTLKVLFQ